VQAIINWLWQGCLVVAAAALLFGRSRRTSATTRYTLWWGTLGAVLLLPLLPMIADAAVSNVAPGDAAAVQLPPLVLPRAPWWLAVSVASLWAAWTTLAVCQAAAGFVRVQRARHNGVPLPAGREDRLRHWPAIRATGRRVRMIASNEVRLAAVLGLGAPTIAIAPGALEMLDDEALDHVLLHEWAHVQRRDDVTRLLQVAVRAAAGVHPAIWWIGRRMDIEREVACDDRVIQITGGAKRYAACLTQVAAAAPGPHSLLFAPGALRHSQLRERVKRLLDGRRNISTTRSAASLAAVMPVLAAITLAAASVELVGTAPAIARALEAREQAMTTTNANSSTAALQQADDVASPGRASHQPASGVSAPLPVSPDGAVPVRRQTPALDTAAQVSGASRRPASKAATEPLPSVALTAPLSSHILHITAAGLSPAAAAISPREAGPGGAEATKTFSGANAPSEMTSPWNTAARAGVAVGRGSQKAALATAGFFTRAGRRIAGSF
jgi:beta-lactamase regulating signal transducer with metallopeptidase domain